MKNTTLQSKLLLICVMAFLLSLGASAQNIIGSWEGVLKVPGMEIPLMFNVEQDGDLLASTMDSPSQGLTGIPMDETTFENNQLTLIFKQAGIKYIGVLESETLKGVFHQGGQEFPLDLAKTVKTKPGDVSLPTSDEDLLKLAAFDTGDYKYSAKDYFSKPAQLKKVKS